MKKILLICIVSIILLSCMQSESKGKTVPKDEVVIETEVQDWKYEKVKIVNGRLIFRNKAKQVVESISDYLSMYSDEELAQVTFLGINNGSLSRIDGLERVSHIERLDLSNNDITQIENLEVLTELVGLGLSSNKIELVDNLGDLPNLKELNLSENPLKDLEGLLDLKNMVHISLYSSTSNYMNYTTDEWRNILDQVLENNKETMNQGDLYL